ncbi:MAG: phosphate ABC transporter permease PstA [Gemmatimonadetes bacterium]|nr:phosphate ABC transporter permease PstA [Gemmatimonadota bacterium]
MGLLRRHGPIGTACALAAGAVLVAFLLLIIVLLAEARPVVDAGFLVDAPSRFAARAGVGPALAGTLWIAFLTAAVAFPTGLGTAIFLEEYAPRTRLTGAIESAIANLAGVPSVVYGVVGLALFARGLGLGASIVAGSLTLAALALPTVIVVSASAIRAVPKGLRVAAHGLGATKWQVIRHQILPAAAPGVLTGCCLAFTRAMGEAAPLLVIGAAAFVTFAPGAPGDPLTSLPTQIFAWTARSQEDFSALAAGACVALLVVLLAMNLVALAVRHRLRGGKR